MVLVFKMQTPRARLAWRYRVTRTKSRHLGRFVIKHSRFFSFNPPVYPLFASLKFCLDLITNICQIG